MFEKPTEPKTKELEEIKEAEARTSAKDIVKEMLKSFYARIRKRPSIEKSEMLPEPIAEEERTDGIEGEEKEREGEIIFPDNAEDINSTEYLGGSSGARTGYFNNELFVIKQARQSADEEIGAERRLNTEQLVEEYIADRIYENMGFSVPVSRIYDGGQYKIAKFISGKDLNTFSRSDPEFERIKSEVQKGFALDCLLANWDVIGSAGGDNIRLGDDGKVYRLDNGGALRFRAKGARKGAGFGEKVGELESLKARNELFSDISSEEINRQIDAILKDQDKIISAIEITAKALDLQSEDFEEVKSIIIKRLAYFQSLRVKPKKEKEKKIDKGIYESVVTNNYFEDWDDTELEGNPGIKDQIKENIIRAEKNNQGFYEKAAVDLGISVEEFKQRLQEKIENMAGQSEFFRATRVDILEKIMNIDGRWKSQFETGTSQGSLNPSYRAEQERKMFGFENNLEKDKEKRPIYGYFSDEEHGAINHIGKIPPPTNVIGYGAINIKIKKDRALEKATITFHDSLSSGSEWPPTPAAKPHFTNLQLYSSGGRILEELKGPSVTNWGQSYTEVQYHNQLTMDDVESIHISLNNSLPKEEIEEVRKIFNKYKAQHPESTIELIEF